MTARGGTIPHRRVTWPQPQLAAILARTAHIGQRDSEGEDFWEGYLSASAAWLRAWRRHPLAEAAAWLHRVLVDTEYTASTLRTAGVAEEVIDCIEVANGSLVTLVEEVAVRGW